MAIDFKPNAKFNAAALRHREVSAQLEELKAEELQLRNDLVKAVFKDGVIPEGTNNVLIGNGWVFKVVGKTNISVDPTLVEEARKLNAALPNPSPAFDQVIVYKPAVSTSALKTLTEEQKNAVLFCCKSSQGAPQISFDLPKRAPK